MTAFGYTPDYFLEALGSFWTTIFGQKDFIKTIINANELNLSNEYLKFCEIILGESIEDIPVFNRENWVNLTFLESELNSDISNAILYGDEGVKYGLEFAYGGRWPDTDASFTLPSNVIEIGEFLCNKVYDPSLVLNKNKDFFTKNGVIHFKLNPFDNTLVPIRDIVNEDGEISDREISLWAPIVIFDKEYLWRRYGVLAGVFKKSSEEYKSLLWNIFAIFFNGPKKRFIEGYLNQIFNLPVIKTDNETINYIVKESTKAIVYTNINTYEISPLSGLRVDLKVGDILRQFAPLSNALELLQETTHPNWWKNRGYFTIPERLLDEGYLSPVVIPNETVEIENKIGAQAVMPLSGTFTEEREAEIKGYTIHIGMGVAIGAPTTTVNTLDFFVGQIKDNIFGVKVDPTKINVPAISDDLFKIFNRVIPIGSSYIILLEIETLEDTYLTDDIVDTIEIVDGITLSDTLLLNVDVKSGYYGTIKIDGSTAIGDGSVIGEVKYSPFPYLQEV
jgi:hypothetical protein